MSTHNSVFLDKASLRPDDLDFSNLEQTGQWQFYDFTDESDVVERIRDAEVVIANKTPLNKNALQQAKNLKLIVIAATGVNNVDLDACRELGIAVCNCQSYGNDSVVQHAFAMIFALANRLAANHHAAQSDWPGASQFCVLDHLPMQLAGKKLGIVGYGALGQKAAEVGKALGMDVLVSARKGQPAAEGRSVFETVIAESDVISLHCPLNDETRDLISLSELKAMKPTALLVNCARGGIVNETDLLAALQQNLIAGAATDVLTEEPPGNGNPLLEYQGHNLIVTPHMAWASREARQTLLDQLAENIQHFKQGNSLRRVC